MRLNSKIADPLRERAPWPGIAKLLFIAVLIVIFFLLAQDMVRHRFFRGGWVDQHGVLKP
jgi:hypothetical protein